MLFVFFPVGKGGLDAVVGALPKVLQGFGQFEGVLADALLDGSLVFANFGSEDALFGHAAHVADESDFVKRPNGPFCGVKMPGFDAVAVVRLEFVVKVVVAFAKGKEGHEEAVAGGAFGCVGLSADGVTEGVDAESHMMNGNDAGDTP